jgi:hypothetical protein
MSATLTNQSNIEMRTVKDLVEGDVIIHTDVIDGSVDVTAYLVTDTSQPQTYGTSTGIMYCNVGLEALKISASSKMGHFTQNGLNKTQNYEMNELDPVAVVVSA